MKSYGKSIIDLEFFQEKQRFFANTLIFSLLFTPPPHTGTLAFVKSILFFIKKYSKILLIKKKVVPLQRFCIVPNMRLDDMEG